MKSQIVFIHGGNSFANREEFYAALRTWTYNPNHPERKRWRDSIARELSDTHEFFVPAMPCKQNADYTAWVIWFEKLFPYLRGDVILIGHSLGGGFLLRYLTENILPASISQLHLVAPVVDELDCPGVGGFSIDLSTWSGFQSKIKASHLWHSSDDKLVPIHHSERLAVKLPTAIFHRFTNYGHFLTEEFPELKTILKGE
jgi:predicted alpha/beta hydrolase family esterase